MRGSFRSFSLSSRPAGGLLVVIVVALLVLLPLVICAIVIYAVFTLLRALFSILASLFRFKAAPSPAPPFQDNEGRRNVRIRRPDQNPPPNA